MQILDTALCDVKLLRPQRHGDARGWFAEMFNTSYFAAAGLPEVFVQDNQSFSHLGVLRGLHYQLRQPQGKLIRVLSGRIWDVAVDVRQQSPEFGRWAAFALAPGAMDEGEEMLWIPEGYAHGFLVLSDVAEVLYKVTRPYDPGGEHTIRWNDPELRIPWPLSELNGMQPIVSLKDASAPHLADAVTYKSL